MQAVTEPLLTASGAGGPSLAEIMEMNFYDALNVQPGATNAEIRRAFKAVALKHHPDKGGDPAIFRYLSTVRDILLNKAKREQYDFHGRDSFADAFSKQPPGGTGNVDANALPGQWGHWLEKEARPAAAQTHPRLHLRRHAPWLHLHLPLHLHPHEGRNDPLRLEPRAALALRRLRGTEAKWCLCAGSCTLACPGF